MWGRRETPASSGPPSPDKPPGRAPRKRVVRRLLDLYPRPRYLEVGVFDGATFHAVTAEHKVAVDPYFRFDHRDPGLTSVPGVEYHPVTSDAYFAALPPDVQFDVIFLDGLHTFEQTLRDLMNALDHLQPRGVIVVDDTHPPTAAAAIPDQAESQAEVARLGSDDKRWMGDVFKLVWFVDTFCPGLSYRTISNNHGQTVLWRHHRGEVRHRHLREVAELDFTGMRADEATLRPAVFRDIRAELASDLGLEARA